MFPNVRLLIAAMFASVLALTFGFGVFAAFRVNHEPLSRLTPVTTPLQLAVRDAATTSAAIATTEPFSSRSQPDDTQFGGGAARLGFAPEHHDEVESSSPAMIEAQSQPAADTPPPETEGAPATVASLPAQPTVQEMPAPTSEPEAKAGAIAVSAPEQTRAQVADAAEAGRDGEQDRAKSEAARGTSRAVATIEPAADQAQPAEQPAGVTETTPKATAKTGITRTTKNIARSTTKTRPRTARSAVRRQRFAARAPRERTMPASATNPDAFNAQDSGLQQPAFQTAPATVRRHPVWTRRIVRKRVQHTAVGGPFVRPKGQ